MCRIFNRIVPGSNNLTQTDAVPPGVGNVEGDREPSQENKIEQLNRRYIDFTHNCQEATTDTEALNQQLSETLSELRKDIKVLEQEVSDDNKPQLKALKEKIERSKKWIDMKFDPSLISTDPDSVDFAVKTQLIHIISTYKNSAQSLEDPQMDIYNVDGVAHVHIKGELKPLREMIELLGDDGIIYYSDGEFERYNGWTFVHPSGFIEHDKFYWERLQDAPPVAKLNQEAVQAIFDKAGAQDDQEYVLEVVSTKTYNLLPSGPLGQVIKKFVNMWMHTHMMVIHRDGRAWSASTLLEKKEYEQVCKGLGTKFAKTGSSKINAPDYVLTRKNCEHFASYFPMNTEQADKIFEHANNLNNGRTRRRQRGDGFDFNMLSENCTKKMGVEPLEILGHTVPAYESGLDSLIKSIPDLEDIPFIGRPLSTVVKAVDTVARPILNLIGKVLSFIPEPIKRVARTIANGLGTAIGYIPRKIAVFVLSLFVVKKLGGRDSTTGIDERHPENPPRLYTKKITDLFNEDKLRVYQGYKLVEWLHENHPEKSVVFNSRGQSLLPLDPRQADAVQQENEV